MKIILDMMGGDNAPLSNLEGAAQAVKEYGVEIIGPCGAVKKDAGAIVALRHIHMSPEDALRFGVQDKDIVNVDAGDGTRNLMFRNVLVRVSDKYRLEMHIDVDEANAAGAKNGDRVRITKRK